jgi:hypothetical protein
MEKRNRLMTTENPLRRRAEKHLLPVLQNVEKKKVLLLVQSLCIECHPLPNHTEGGTGTAALKGSRDKNHQP